MYEILLGDNSREQKYIKISIKIYLSNKQLKFALNEADPILKSVHMNPIFYFYNLFGRLYF